MPKPLFLRRASGLYVRFLVPVHARAEVGSRFIVRALGNLRGDSARLEAARLGYALAHQFNAMKRRMPPAAPPSARLGESIDLYLAKHPRAAPALRLFLGLVGDKPLSMLSAADVDTFAQTLPRWPASASRSAKYKRLTPRDVLALDQRNPDARFRDRLTPETERAYLVALRDFCAEVFPALVRAFDRRLGAPKRGRFPVTVNPEDLEPYVNTYYPNGMLKSSQADGPEDHARAMEAAAQTAAAAAAQVAKVTAPTTVYAPPTVAAMLGERIALFVKQFSQKKRAESNKKDTAFSLRLFVGVVGDKPLAALDATDIDTFLDAIAVWPPNASKLRAFKDLTPAQVVAKAKKLGGEAIADRTQEKHLDRLRMFFNWCLGRKEIACNWAKDTHVMTRAQEEERTRRAYLPAELRLLFDPANRARYCDTPGKWWIPLLALYSGARVTELSQLMTADVETIDGVCGYHIAARFTGQHVKNPKTKRFVPLHPALLAAGFLDYWRDVSARAPGITPLFPGLGANPGDKVGDWWNRTYLTACGVTDPVLVFHCFRNTFATQASRAGVEPGRIARITGHSVQGSILHQHYIDAPTVGERAADVAAVNYEGLPSLAVYDPATFAEFFHKLGNAQKHRAAKVARAARQSKK